MERYRIIFKGTVQGVGFRMFAQQFATKRGLTGYAKNLYTGDVEVEVQGDEEEIKAFVFDMYNCKRGLLRVEDYHLKKVSIDPTETSFKARY
ncbi:MAG: acylphosphatase [Erysipelotrichaceae bacterium]|nr:acylphosphatase [Erysipelotrichaceae bacterium]